MIRINLVPDTPESAYRNQALRDFSIVAVLCITIYFGVDFVGQRLDEKIADLDSKIAAQNETKDRFKKDIQKAKEIKERVETIRQRGRKVKELGEGRKIPVVLLDNLQSKHPERMWFNKISFTTRDNVLVLTGYALDHSVIADYLKRLKEIGRIDASDSTVLKDFVPRQLINGEILTKSSIFDESKNEIKVLDQVVLKSLQSVELQGVTLQRFEITIKMQNG